MIVHRGKLNNVIFFGLACVLAGLIFYFDLSLPLGVAGAVPYIAVMFIAWQLADPRSVLFFAVICSFLTWLGYLYSPEGGVTWVVLTNRGFAI